MNENPILLVEDNRGDEVLALLAFKRGNVSNQVVVARDGEDALNYLRNPNNKLPTLILLDLKLPKASGLEVLRHVRTDERTKLVPVIVLTSSIQESDLRDSYTAGSNGYLHKSLDFNKFAETIDAFSKYWLIYNETPRAAPGAVTAFYDRG